MNLGKLLTKGAKVVKDNPELALAIAGLLAPKLVTKVAPKVAAAVAIAKAAK